MTGSPETLEKGIPEKVRDIMVRFDVNEKQAREFLGCSALLASEIVAKWKKNLRRTQKQKAEEILELIKRARNGDSEAFAEAESKLEAICETASWER